jgi:uncharacterized protein (DUF1778 family)
MKTIHETKVERIQFRIDHDTKQTIERAAALANSTVSAFAVNSVLNAARQIIREHEQIVLGQRDWEVFYDALVNPPKRTKRIQKAFAAHDRLISRTVGG